MSPRIVLALAALAAAGVLVGLARTLVEPGSVRGAGELGAEPAAVVPTNAQEPAPEAVSPSRDAAREPMEPATGASPAAASAETTAPAEEAWLVVHVTAIDKSAGGIPVPELEIEAGVGTPRVQRVAPLATGTTDLDGKVELRVPWSAVEAYQAGRSFNGSAWARPSSLGWQAFAMTKPLPKEPAPLQIELKVLRGITLRGRLLGEDGSPAAGSIHAHGITLASKVASGFGEADASGGFEVHLGAEGRYDLVAVSEADDTRDGPAAFAGSGVLRGVEALLAKPAHDLELRLTGSSRLQGRVQTVDGKPAAGLDIDIRAAHLADREEFALGPDPLLLDGAGGIQAMLRTGADGEFDVRGLHAGLYEVVARRGDRFTDRVSLTPAPVPSDGPPLVLMISGSRMIVHVVDESGSRWTRGPALKRSRDQSLGGWPMDPSVVAVVVPETFARTWGEDLRPSFLKGSQVADGSLAFDVTPGQAYLVGMLGGPYAWRPKPVNIPPAGGRVDVTLELERNQFGTLSLSVSDAQGSVSGGFGISIEDLATRQVLVERDPSSRDLWPLKIDLPVGGYRIRVEGVPSTDFFHGVLRSPSRIGRFETDIKISAEQILPIEAYLPAGARIDLALRGEAEPGDAEALERKWAGIHEESKELFSKNAEIWLLADDRWPSPVSFRFEITGSSAAGTHLRSELPLGTRQTSEIVPAGRYVLEARLPGGRVASTPITLVDGETAVVTLEL